MSRHSTNPDTALSIYWWYICHRINVADKNYWHSYRRPLNLSRSGEFNKYYFKVLVIQSDASLLLGLRLIIDAQGGIYLQNLHDITIKSHIYYSINFSKLSHHTVINVISMESFNVRVSNFHSMGLVIYGISILP